MTMLFELLYHYWCVPYDPERFPEYLRKDPVHTYGQYAFEEGFKLGAQLTCLSLHNPYMQTLE